jgi:hypothetical protein
VRAASERLDVQRLRVLPVDPVVKAAQPREVAQVMPRGGSAGHLRDRATSRRRCPAPPASQPTSRPLWPGLLPYVLDLFMPCGIRTRPTSTRLVTADATSSDASSTASNTGAELATRYDKHAIAYRGGLVLAAVLLWLTDLGHAS